MSLLPCPQCGSEAEIYSTGTMECYGWAWQNYGVRCKDTKGQHCDMEISMQADFFHFNIDDGYWEEIWNNLPVRAKI
jgi:hypothetical protein